MIVNRQRIPTWQLSRGMTRTQPPMLSIVLGGMFVLLGLLWLVNGIVCSFGTATLANPVGAPPRTRRAAVITAGRLSPDERRRGVRDVVKPSRQAMKAHLELQDRVVLTGKKLAFRVVNDGDIELEYMLGPITIEHWTDGEWTAVMKPAGWWAPLHREIAAGTAGPWMTLVVPRESAVGHYRFSKTVRTGLAEGRKRDSVTLSIDFEVEEDPART